MSWQDEMAAMNERRLLTEEVTRLRAQLDHYRGTCDYCGREGVLLETDMENEPYETGYLVRYCWEDAEGCRRIVEERWRPHREKYRAAALRGWETRRKREGGQP